MGTSPIWEDGKQYPIKLGGTLLGTSDEAFWTLRYDFKPASVADTGTGLISVDLSTHKTSLQLPSKVQGAPALQFQGKQEPSKDSLDCILLFDGTQFILERADAAVKTLRHIPASSRARGALPSAQSDSIEQEDRHLTAVRSPPSVNEEAADDDAVLDELESELLSELAGSPTGSPPSQTAQAQTLGPEAAAPASPVEVPRLLASRDVIGRDIQQARAQAAQSPAIAGPSSLGGNSPVAMRKKARTVRAPTPTPEELQGLTELDKEFFGSLTPGEEDDETSSDDEEEELRPDRNVDEMDHDAEEEI